MTELKSNNSKEKQDYGSVDDLLKEIESNKTEEASLILEDSTVIKGLSFGAKLNVSGEVVFNTGMVGYPESLTDPSYNGQILVLTYPLIGNYGVPSENIKDEYGLLKHFESSKIQITALIISDYSFDHSHYSANISLSTWLKKHNIPALYNIDTRMLTKKLRINGSMLGKIQFKDLKAIDFINPYDINLVANVSRKEIIEFNKPQNIENNNSEQENSPSISDSEESSPTPTLNGEENNNKKKRIKTPKIIAIDCGMKNNIIRYLCSKNVYLKVVPWNYDFNNEDFDGLFISNGPGDPTMCKETILNVRKFLNTRPNTPLFGICLGNQILALAANAKTYKMKFGNRGMNQPVIDLRTSRCYITPQNHGFAVDDSTLPKHWKPFFRNANDHSNEGIIHSYKPYFSVQFHPEAQGGPTDTEFLFDMFLSRVRHRNRYEVTIVDVPNMLSSETISSVLILGSGGLSIGQAGEFDYSGSQAIKALKEENVKIILLNPNIATVQTSDNMADETYFLPVTYEYVLKVIQKERPDGILLQFGGQTALNCGIELKNKGTLEKYNVKVLGTPIDTIEMTEDRGLFAEKLKDVNEKVAPSITATNINEGILAAKKIGYPVLIRAAFALGGLGSGFANNEKELINICKKAFVNSDQIIIDRSLKGWKEVEYEVVRDRSNNCITVCNMENFDPLGIHTGDSIVVAPSQTLSNDDYYMLRSAAIKIVRHLGVVGECNIQYALDPLSKEYFVIEVNARLSRSSALASKATGYPLAYVAAKLAMGKTLPIIKNSITKVTQACFEPALDYCVVKIPRWDLKKFEKVSSDLGSCMKSVGEVMAIDRKFEAAFSKALRMVNDHCDGFGYIPKRVLKWSNDKLIYELKNASDLRVYAIALAFKRGFNINKLYKLTNIDKWFLCKLRNIIIMEKRLELINKKLNNNLFNIPKNLILISKQLGFSDLQLSRILNSNELKIRELRKKHNILPFVKQIDTLAAEFPASTNYLYMTYNGNEHDLKFDENGIMILGCGAYRIGSSCEFDWCAVSAVRTLRDMKLRLKEEKLKFYQINNIKNHSNNNYSRSHSNNIYDIKNKFNSIVVNYNPETVSTDYDECDRLYFEELSFERVLDIYELEESQGVIVSVGGQISNNLSMPLYNQGVKILGTQPDSIDCAENRHRFSKLLDKLHINQPLWCEAKTFNEALEFSQQVGYPILIRPSYVLSGAAMSVVSNKNSLKLYLEKATNVSRDHPVVISKFITKSKEIEVDAVAKNGQVLNYAISEHIENAGVHSGDATLILPAQNIYVETFKRIKIITKKIAKALNITGPFNIQYLCKNNNIKVIECNLRASRSFPFVSKTFNVNFINLATKAMVEDLYINNYNINNDNYINYIKKYAAKTVEFNLFNLDYVCIKSPMFSFTRLSGADPILSVEMSSTGEVACFGSNKYEALLKSLISANFKLPIPNPHLSPSPDQLRLDYIKEDIGLITYNNSENISPIRPQPIKQTPESKHKYLFSRMSRKPLTDQTNTPNHISEEEQPKQPKQPQQQQKQQPIEYDVKEKENNINKMITTLNDDLLIQDINDENSQDSNNENDEKISQDENKYITPKLRSMNSRNSNIKELHLDSSDSIYSLSDLPKDNKSSKVYTCNVLITIGPENEKYDFLESTQLLHTMGYKLHATEGTHQFLKSHGIKSALVPKPSSGLSPNCLDLITNKQLDLVINCPGHGNINNTLISNKLTDGYYIRRKSIDFDISLITNIQLAKQLVRSLAKKYLKSYEYHFDKQFLYIKSWKEHVISGPGRV